MSSKDFNNSEEVTKEVLNLDELNEEALEKLEDTYQDIMDENLIESDLQFQEQIESLEIPEDTVIIEEPEEPKKKKKKFSFHDIKEKWHNLPKNKKAITIIIALIILLLLGVGIYFLCRSTKVEAPNVPDVIVEEDNYRYENGTLVFLNEEEELGKYECANKDDSLCYIAYLTENDDFDGLKKVDEDNKTIEKRSKIYQKRFVFIFDNKNKTDKIIKLYDIQDKKTILEGTELKAYEKQDNIAIFKDKDSKVGMLTFNETEASKTIPFEYDFLGILPDDHNRERIVAKKDSSYYLINENNEVLTNAMNTLIVGANANHLKTKDDTNVYRVYNYKGKEIGTGDYITLLDNYVLIVKDMKIYVTDYNKNPMNLDGIALQNDQYNPVAVYKDKKLITTKKSFEVEVYDKTLTLKIYSDVDSETKTIHLEEGIISSKLGFINYFDGKLYVYKDAAKKDLLGTYPCNNKNDIANNQNELNNCTIAREMNFQETNGNDKEKDHSSELGTIPIFNDRFAFIKDGNETIVLYDFTTNASKAWYKNVDTSSYTKTNDITFVKTNNVYYIGQSERSGKFGLAKITPDNVEVQIAFEYKSMKRLGDYFVVESDDGYYLADLGGKLLNEKKPTKDPIVDYHGKYLKTMKDNAYQVYSLEEEISPEKYSYIELYDEYYAAVLNNKLSVFKYFEEEPVIDNIELFLNNYTGDKTKAFKIKIEKNVMTIEVSQTNNQYKTAKVLDLNESKPVKPTEEPQEEANESGE